MKKAKKNAPTAKKPEQKPAEWAPQDVMLFAGEIMAAAIKLSENGNAHEKRVCQKLVSGATVAVTWARHRRMVEGLGL
jgi:hypothetical protein